MTTTRARDTRPAAPVSQQQLNNQNFNNQNLNRRPARNHPHRAALKHSTCSAHSQNFTPNSVQTDRTNAARLFQALHQGGAYAHLWTDAGNQSFWFTTASPNCARLKPQTERVLYRQWVRHNVFFSVHPLGRMPPHNSSGNGNPRYISSQLPYIVAINALFAEYDGKDQFGFPNTWRICPLTMYG